MTATDLAAKLIYTAPRSEQHGALMLSAAVELDRLRALVEQRSADVRALEEVTTPFVQAYRRWALNPGDGYDALIELCEDMVARLERVI